MSFLHPRVILVSLAAAFISLVLLCAPVRAADRYVALGDSYASGLGTGNDGGSCRRSADAYPAILARERPGTTLSFVACAGARVPDILRSQVDALSAATTLVTVSVGGNDAGFAHVIARCVLPWPVSCSPEIDAARAFVHDMLPARLAALYIEVRRRAPRAKVIVVGYPRLFYGRTCTVTGGLSSPEELLLNQTGDLLRDATRAQARAAGFLFADPTPTFGTHAVCSADPWVNGLSWPPSESFHPDRAGHRLGYAALLRPLLG